MQYNISLIPKAADLKDPVEFRYADCLRMKDGGVNVASKVRVCLNLMTEEVREEGAVV